MQTLPKRVRHRVRRSKYYVLGSFVFEPEAPLVEGDILYVGGVSAELQTAKSLDGPVWLVVYVSEDDGKRWARPLDEFVDGRFEEI